MISIILYVFVTPTHVYESQSAVVFFVRHAFLKQNKMLNIVRHGLLAFGQYLAIYIKRDTVSGFRSRRHAWWRAPQKQKYISYKINFEMTSLCERNRDLLAWSRLPEREIEIKHAISAQRNSRIHTRIYPGCYHMFVYVYTYVNIYIYVYSEYQCYVCT